MRKLTFFTLGEDTFLRDIVISLRKDYDIKFFQRGTNQEFFQTLHDTDIAWFEFCDNLIIEATKYAKICKTICRLHSYEMFTDLPAKVDWNKVDKLIFVNPIVKEYCLKKFNIRPDITTVIHNGINLNKFEFNPSKKLTKKIAYIGFINYKKGPELLLQAFKAIHDYDNEFEFFIAGVHQDERIKLYFDNIGTKLGFRIQFDGWVKDVSTYLEDKSFVISSSLFESFQYSLAEGMAQGCVPLVHSWLGSDIFYPSEYIWTFPNQCVDIIRRIVSCNNSNRWSSISLSLRNHVEKNFNFNNKISEIKNVIESIEKV